MKRCVQNGPVTPMAEQWWLDILRMIPPRLVSAQHLQSHIIQLQEEVHEEYEASMKKAMGNIFIMFILQNMQKYPNLSTTYFACSSIKFLQMRKLTSESLSVRVDWGFGGVVAKPLAFHL